MRTMVQQFSRQMPCPQGSVPEEWMGRLSVVTVKFAIGRDGFPSRFESMPHGLADRIAPEIWRAVQSCHWIAGTDVQGHPTAIWSSCPSGSPSSDQLHPSRTINSCRSNGSPASPPRSAHTTRVGRANINARWIEHEWGDDWHLRDTRHESGRRGALRQPGEHRASLQDIGEDERPALAVSTARARLPEASAKSRHEPH